MKHTFLFSIAAVAALALPADAEAKKKKKEEVQLVKCEQSYGSIAVVDGDTQGWSEYRLGSPRELINSLALESGCFTPVNLAAGESADYLMNIIAGDKEEVDKSVDLAKTAASEALVRSGALSSIASKVPIGGALIGMFGGFGGKKTTIAAGIKVLSPANGQTLALGTGEVRKSSLSFGNGAGAWVSGAQSVGYAKSKKGKLMVEAFVLAFNEVAAQAANLQAMTPAASPEPAQATVAVDTAMYAKPSNTAEQLRSLRAGTTLTPTGKRDGLFVEMEDGFGTKGWVSVEELN